MGLVCVAWSVDNSEAQSLWLYKDQKEKNRFKEMLLDWRNQGAKFMCFNASAEARCFVALGVNPIKCKWIDLQCEWKMLTNHCDYYRYGNQLIDGREKVTSRKDYYGAKRLGKDHSRPDMSLLACTYKLLGVNGDLEYKNKMRRMILNNTSFNQNQKKEILNYCTSDVGELFDIKNKIMDTYNTQLPTKIYSRGKIVEEILYRGDSAARAALIESIGIPINREWTVNLASQVQTILDDCAKEILELFPNIKPFQWNSKSNRYSKCVKNIQDFISNSKYADTWERTDQGAISLKLEAFTEHFSFRHEYPKDNFYAQMIRYLKLDQHFNGLKPKPVNSKRGNFFDHLGSDNRVRPFLNVYGAQSARYQAKATGFPFLWAAWIRSVVQPKKGYAICGVDYASQEFLIAALISKDDAMIEAYKSGDPYLYLGKKAGVIPEEGTKKSHKRERDIFKWVTLGIGYGMTKAGLSKTLSEQLGEQFSEKQADDLIDLYFRVYKKYSQYRNRLIGQMKKNEDGSYFITNGEYKSKRCIKLSDGWYMFGDNDNDRSVANVPIQGEGSCILRKAVALCQDAGLKVIFPLHDALYVEGPVDCANDWVDLLLDKMSEAFQWYFDDKESAKLMRLDPNIWGPTLTDGYLITSKGVKVKSQTVYVDERSISEYNKFSRYFTNKAK